MQTRLYRLQHGELRRILTEAASSLVPMDPDACRSSLAKLAGVLRIHLIMEDNVLYPQMLTHSIAAVRRTAADYRDSMGQLAPVFETFHEKWRAHGAIEAFPAEFARGYRVIGEALRQRMDMEDANLYDLVDRHVDLAS